MIFETYLLAAFLLIGLALVFDFTNGFLDFANLGLTFSEKLTPLPDTSNNSLCGHEECERVHITTSLHLYKCQCTCERSKVMCRQESTIGQRH